MTRALLTLYAAAVVCAATLGAIALTDDPARDAMLSGFGPVKEAGR